MNSGVPHNLRMVPPTYVLTVRIEIYYEKTHAPGAQPDVHNKNSNPNPILWHPSPTYTREPRFHHADLKLISLISSRIGRVSAVKGIHTASNKKYTVLDRPRLAIYT